MKQGSLYRIFGGLAIASVGVLFILHQMGVLGFQHLDLSGFISRYWPLVLMLMGLTTLLSGGSIWAGTAMLLFGTVMLARNIGFTYWSFGDAAQYLLPVVAVLFGLRMIFHRGGRKRKEKSQGDWNPYTSYQGPIPPAPPLHPDPLDSEGRPDAPQPGSKEGPRMDVPPHSWVPEHAPREDDVRRPHGESGYDRRSDWRQAKQEWKQAKRSYKEAHRRHHSHRSHRDHRGGRGWDHARTEWWSPDSNAQTRSNFIGDIHLGHDYWDLVPLNISHFIGDTVLDLTRANIPAGETRITISSFIGDVKVFLPADLDVGIQVVSSAFIGDSKVLGRKEGGLFQHSDTQSPSFRDSERRIKLICSTFIGDVRVTKVG